MAMPRYRMVITFGKNLVASVSMVACLRDFLRELIPYLFAEVNLFLGIFNFLPIPPLDGAALIERVLPESALEGWYRFRPYGIVVLFLLVFSTDVTSRLFQPFLDQLYRFVFR